MTLFGLKIASYWHVEIFAAVPLIVYAIWRTETIVHLLKICTL